jgi:hypothetical protein
MKKIQFKFWHYITASPGRERLNYVDGDLVGYIKTEIDGVEKEMGVVNSEEYGIILVPKDKIQGL